MDVSKFLVFAIPKYENKEKNLMGEIYYKEYKMGDMDHRDFCEDFIKKHNLDHKNRGQSHFDYALTFCENDILLGCNSGVLVDGKYFCTIFLNESLSDYQMQFFDSQKMIYEEKFHKLENLFSVLVFSKEMLSYKSGYPNFRNLKIEALIQKNPNAHDGQALLYQELSRQKLLQIENQAFKR